MKNIARTFILGLALIGISFAETPTTTITATATTPTTVIATPTIATPPPASLPIGSKGMLRAYALEQVCGSQMSIWSESVIWDSASITSVYFHPETPPTIDEAIAKLNSSIFQFKVADKSKPLNVWGTLHNSEGMTLFFGYCPANISAQGSIICDELVMKLNGNVPVYVGPDVHSAQIRSGNNWVDLYPCNGYIFFPIDYTDKEGMLILNVGDHDIAYSLRDDGSQIPLVSVSGEVGTKIDGYYSFTADNAQTGIVYVNLGNCQVGEGHEAPVASINITSTNPKTVKFLCRIWRDGQLVEQPAYGWIYKKGDDTEMPVSLLPGQWSGTMTLGKGQWFFYMETSFFETPVPVIIGGGKG